MTEIVAGIIREHYGNIKYNLGLCRKVWAGAAFDLLETTAPYTIQYYMKLLDTLTNCMHEAVIRDKKSHDNKAIPDSLYMKSLYSYEVQFNIISKEIHFIIGLLI